MLTRLPVQLIAAIDPIGTASPAWSIAMFWPCAFGGPIRPFSVGIVPADLAVIVE